MRSAAKSVRRDLTKTRTKLNFYSLETLKLISWLFSKSSFVAAEGELFICLESDLSPSGTILCLL